jgi:hypothetical protein
VCIKSHNHAPGTKLRSIRESQPWSKTMPAVGVAGASLCGLGFSRNAVEQEYRALVLAWGEVALKAVVLHPGEERGGTPLWPFQRAGLASAAPARGGCPGRGSRGGAAAARPLERFSLP